MQTASKTSTLLKDCFLPGGGDDIKFTKDEVSRHNKEIDAWTIINNEVYDITPFISKHPGGLLILKHIGSNSTDDFYRYGHSSEAKFILEQFKIGSILEEKDEDEEESEQKERLHLRDILKENQVKKETFGLRDILQESRVEKLNFRDLLKESRIEEKPLEKMDLWKFLENSSMKPNETITFEDLKKNKQEFSKFKKYLKTNNLEVYLNFLIDLQQAKSQKEILTQKMIQKLFDDYISPVKANIPLKLHDNTFSWLIIKYKAKDPNLFDLAEQEVTKKILKCFAKYKDPKKSENHSRFEAEEDEESDGSEGSEEKLKKRQLSSSEEIKKLEKKFSTMRPQLKYAHSNPFIQSVISGNYQEVKEFIVEKKVDIDQVDDLSKTALHRAAFSGNLEICLLLLGYGANINIKDSMGYTPLALSVKYHHWEVAQNLSLFGADFEIKKKNGMTVLHESLQYGDSKTLDWILEKGKNKLNGKDNLGQTPFLRSLEKSPLPLIIKYMKIDGVNIEIEDNNSRNFFHFAARNQRDDFLFYLIENNIILKFASSVGSCEKLTGQNALHYAVRYGTFRTVKLMTKIFQMVGVTIHSKDKFGDTSIILCDQVAERIFKDYIMSNNHYSLEKIQDKVKRYLKMKNYLLNVKESPKELLKIKKVLEKINPITKLISNEGTKKMEQNEVVESSTIVDEIESRVVENKIEKEEVANKIDFRDALKESRIEKFDFRDILKESRIEQEKPVDLREFLGDSKIEREEITFESIRKNKQFSKFRKYLKSEEMDHYVQFLIDLYSSEINETSIETIFNQYFSPIKSSQILELSSNTIASILLKYKSKDPTLFELPEKEVNQLVIKFYKRFKNPKSNKKLQEFTTLSSNVLPIQTNESSSDLNEIDPKLEIQSKDDQPIEEETLLSPTSSDPFLRDDKLIKSVVSGNFDLVKELLQDPNENQTTNSIFNETLFSQLRFNQTLLHFAVLGSHVKIVEYLIDKGCDPNAVDQSKRTPLHLSSNSGSEEITILLLGSGAKLNLKDAFGYTPLYLAVKNHYWNICEHLLLFGADLNAKKVNGMNLLHESLKDNDKYAVEWILKKSIVKLNSKDHMGLTPLFFALESSSLELIKLFLNTKGVDMYATDNISRNIFHMLAKSRRVDVLEYILENFELEKYENLIKAKEKLTEQSPLHYAVKYGNFQTVRLIFELMKKSNGNIYEKDSSNDTPITLCDKMIEKSFSDFISSNQIIYPHKLNNRLQEYKQMKQYILSNCDPRDSRKKLNSKRNSKLISTPKLSLRGKKKTDSPISDPNLSPRADDHSSIFNNVSNIFKIFKSRSNSVVRQPDPQDQSKSIQKMKSISNSEMALEVLETKPKRKYKRGSLDLEVLNNAGNGEFRKQEFEDNHRLERGEAILDIVKIVDETEYTFGFQSPRLHSVESSDLTDLMTDYDAEDYDLDHPDILNILNRSNSNPQEEYEMF
eukprot:gene4185-7495_t